MTPRTILAALTALMISVAASLFGQDPVPADSVTFKDGKVMIPKDGKSVEATNDVTLQGGIYVATDVGAVPTETILVALFGRLFGTRRQKMSGGGRSQADTRLMKELIEAGALRPVIDRTYPMAEVAEAHRYVETWRKAGNVVLTID